MGGGIERDQPTGHVPVPECRHSRVHVGVSMSVDTLRSKAGGLHGSVSARGHLCAHCVCVSVWYYFFLSFFWPHHTACGTLVPRPGIEPVPPAAEAQSLNHWTAREVRVRSYF